MLYLVLFEYYPNTAASNRMIAYAKALSEIGEKARVVFFRPDPKRSKFEMDLPGIEFVYLWDKRYINIPKLNRISLRYYLKKFLERLKDSDVVYVYDFPDLVVSLSKCTGVRFYEERTEHIDVHFRGKIMAVNKQEYLKSCAQANGVVVISQSLKEFFIENGCKEERVHVINMIVDTSRFTGVKKQDDKFCIAYCGTAFNNKDGVDELIKSFSIVVKKHPNYKLIIIGSIPGKMQKIGNFRLVEELGIEGKVEFTGEVSRNRIPQLLSDATILALDRPNNIQAQNGFPTKLGEYLLTGNPVVVTNVGDISLFLQDGVSALIAEPQNPQSFANKLCWAIEHPEEAKVIGEEGKRVALNCFNYITETKKLVDIING